MFSPEDVLAKIRRRPYQPIRIVATSGTYDIHHPDLVLVGRRFVEIGTASAENPETFEKMTSVALVHIAEIQDLPANHPTNGQNGKHE